MKFQKIYFLLILGLIVRGVTFGQNEYSINIDVPEKKIVTGHLDLGGTNPQGERIDVNSYFITKDGKPFFPVLGEFHYSRYPSEYWDESIKKIKAGGINIITTYIFWNLHERTEGEFDWSNNLNLRRFAELCAKNDIYLIVRMGPFAHGEMRNGGIPDWMYGRTFEIRSNNEGYLHYVNKLYGEIADQCRGLLYKDGGPIIGVQLENEFQHSAAPWEITYPGAKKEYTVAEMNAEVTHEQISVTDGVNPYAEEGKDHMATLKQIVLKHGMDVPLYTATGWGNAAIVEKGSIPVTAGYAYPFWAPPSPSSLYLFKNIHKYPDYMPVSYDAEMYPSIPAEIGPGIQPIYSRRPIVNTESVLPLMVRIVGSGSNGIGYYMYHGGSTPVFDGKFFNENINGIPKINYDFQAPIGQYGQIRSHFNSLKTLHMFLNAYGEQLAPMKTILPENNEAITPEDLETLRFAVRSKENSGFLFMINFQDHLENMDIINSSIAVQTAKETVRFPYEGTFDLKESTSAILPFNLQLGNTKLKSATVQPLTVLNLNGEKHFIFQSFEGIAPEFLIEEGPRLSNFQNSKKHEVGGSSLVTGKNAEIFSFKSGNDHYLVLPFEMALHATKLDEYLIISKGLITKGEEQMSLVTRDVNTEIHIYPALKKNPKVSFASIKEIKPRFNGASSFSLTFVKPEPILEVKQVTERKFSITASKELGKLNNVFLEVDYVGDRGMAFMDGLLVTDHFYQEKKWEIGIKEFLPELLEKDMVLIFHPMYDDQEFLIDLSEIPEFKDGKFLKVNEIDTINEYKAILYF